MNKKLDEQQKKISKDQIRKIIKKYKEMNKIVKGIILSVLLFVIATVWFNVAKNLYPRGNPFVDIIIILALSCFIVSLLFVREKNLYDSIIFGILVGFIEGTFLLVYWMAVPMVTAPDPSADYGLVCRFWIFFTMFFTGSSVIGSSLSYLIREIKGGLKK